MKLNDGMVFAKFHLEGKVDKAGEPIFDHCLRVSYYMSGNASMVAILHEVIEDGGVTVDELRERFGNEVAEAVDAISRRDGESYMTYINRCSLNKTAREVKIADLKDNMDITRLKKITNEDLNRLKKYHKAYRYLVDAKYWTCAQCSNFVFKGPFGGGHCKIDNGYNYFESPACEHFILDPELR